MMHMTFYWSRQVTLLVDSWRTDSWASYGLTLLACFLCSVFYQYLEDLRVRVKIAAAVGKTVAAAEAEEPLIGAAARTRAARIGGAVFFGVNSGVGYMLMLAVMSFNGGVFLAIVVGIGVGYGLFRSGEEEEVPVVAAAENPCACA